jgi:hypothetical protein
MVLPGPFELSQVERTTRLSVPESAVMNFIAIRSVEMRAGTEPGIASRLLDWSLHPSMARPDQPALESRPYQR